MMVSEIGRAFVRMRVPDEPLQGAVARESGPMLEEARRRRGDLEALLQCLRKRRLAALQRHWRRGVKAKTVNDLLDKRRIVADGHPERVSRLEGKVGARER